MDSYWCINDVWCTIETKYSDNELWLSDSGVGQAWSNVWKKELSKQFVNERKNSICVEIGLDVWYYPPESRCAFFNWLGDYIDKKKTYAATHKSKSPVLPTSNYHITEKYAGKTAYFTGFYPDDKKTIADVIIPQTGIIAEKSFKKSTAFLIMGPNRGPSKIRNAQDWGIPCISVEVFIDDVTVEI